MSTLLDRFLSYLEENAYILDFGVARKGYKYFWKKVIYWMLLTVRLRCAGLHPD